MAVIYATFAVAKRKAERKKKLNDHTSFNSSLRSSHIYFHIFITSQLQLYCGLCFENEETNTQ